MIKNYIYKTIPYLIILVCSFFALYILFYEGFPGGDDMSFHFPNIYELFSDLKSGNDYQYISSQISSGFGSGTRLFYSPLPHYSVALLGVIYSWFGLSLMQAFKSVIFITVFLSGIIVYRFGLRITKNKIVPALIISVIFILYPYRLFDFFCRSAFAEGFAIMFIPLFFFGLYDLVYLDKYKISTFMKIIFGAGLLFLTHNITAVYTFIFGVLYLLMHIKRLLPKFKDKDYIISGAISIVIIIGMIGFTLFQTYELMNTGNYNLTNGEIMWTTVHHLKSRSHEAMDFSGFLNFSWITQNNVSPRANVIINFLFIYVLFSIFYFFGSYSMENLENVFKKSKNKYLNKISRSYLILILSVIYLVLVIKICDRIELTLASIILILITNLLFLKKEEYVEEEKKIYKDINIWFSILTIAIIILLMNNEDIWGIMPSILRNIQFPWRLWAIFQTILVLLVGSIFRYYSNKKLLSASILATSMLLALNMPLFQKRVTGLSDGKGYNISSDVNTQGENGWNKEYYSYKLTDSNYTSEYSNSLNRTIYKFFGKPPKAVDDIVTIVSGSCQKNTINTYGGDVYMDISTSTGFTFYTYQPYIEEDEDGGYIFTIYNKATYKTFYGVLSDYNGYVSSTIEPGSYILFIKYKPYSLSPAFLEGDVIINSRINYNKMNVTINTSSLIQMPLIYYPGYKIYAYKNGEKIELDAIDVDGLLSFNIDSGDYDIEILYEGTTIRKLSNIYFKISYHGIFILGLYGILIENERRRKKGIRW